MKLFHTVNSGWLIRNGPFTLLIDALHAPEEGFSDMPEDFFDSLLYGGEPAPRICGTLFTHKHADHYDEEKLQELQQARGPFSVIDERTPSYPGTALLSLGPFNVTRFRTVHDGPAYREVPHVSYLICSGDTALLFPGDSAMDNTTPFSTVIRAFRRHASVYAFFNPYQLHNPNTWQLVDECGINHIIVNHLPREEDDIFDIRGVAAYTMERMPERNIIIPEEMNWLAGPGIGARGLGLGRQVSLEI